MFCHFSTSVIVVQQVRNVSDGNAEDWKRTLDTNVLGLSICTREALQSMKAHGFDDGHIFNINRCLRNS